MKNIRIFHLKIFILVVKFSVSLNRHVFIMCGLKFGICFVFMCSSSLFLLVPREGCVS